METVYKHEPLDDLGQLDLTRYVDMDQTNELNYLLKVLNFSDVESTFNFSDAEALGYIREFLDKMYTLHSPSTIVLISLYIPVFLLSLAGNGLVIFVVCRNNHMRRVKNLFLMNLALADLLVTLICMPMIVGQIVVRLWVYGTVMCKVSAYMQGVAVLASIFTLTALSVDRYLALKAPLSAHRINTKKQALRCLVTIWVLSALFLAPVLYVRNLKNVDFERFGISVTVCIERWPQGIYRKSYAIFLLLLTYAIPILIISICYSMIGRTLCSDEFHRKTSDSSSTVMLGRKRVARMLIALIVLFIFCWLPYNIFSLSLDVSSHINDALVLPFTLCLAHAHSAVNPILYWFLNKNFRHSIRKALTCQSRGQRAGKDTPSPHRDAGGLGRPSPRLRSFRQQGRLLSSPRPLQQLQVKQAGGYKDLEMASPSYLQPKHKRSTACRGHRPSSTSSSTSSDSSSSEDEPCPLPPSLMHRKATPGKRLLRVRFGPTSTITTELTPSTSSGATTQRKLSLSLPLKSAVRPTHLILSSPPTPSIAPLATPESSLSPPDSPTHVSVHTPQNSNVSQPSCTNQEELYV